jgi:protein associated with RNAse G/E
MMDLDPEIFKNGRFNLNDISKYISKNMMVYQKPLGSYIFLKFEEGQIQFKNDRRKLIQEKLSNIKKLTKKNSV